MNNILGFLNYIYLKYFHDFLGVIIGILMLPLIILSIPLLWVWNEYDNYKEYLEEIEKDKAQ